LQQLGAKNQSQVSEIPSKLNNNYGKNMEESKEL
jgi:hypothetical protein